MQKIVLVSGCFDLLHSGHIAFFEEAARYGDLYVALGSDRTVFELKGQIPVNNQDERLYMVQAISFVKHAFISGGSGILDFESEFIELRPNYFVVNRDGHMPEKSELCQKYGVEYIVLKRKPHGNLLPRSTTALRNLNIIPFRIDLAGGWLDQPFVSKYHPGAVITISIQPTVNFNDRSGMASSTRRSAIDLWGSRLPVGLPEKLAKILFCYDNPPGTKVVSGSQDSIGIVFPGLAFAYYDGKYWPEYIEQVTHEPYLQFVEQVLYLVPLGPRHADYNVLENTHVDSPSAKRLADATLNCWDAIKQFNLPRFGAAIRDSFDAQVRMFPNMMNPSVNRLIEKYQDVALGWKLSGAGGGGYLILVSEEPIENAIQVIARRTDP